MSLKDQVCKELGINGEEFDFLLKKALAGDENNPLLVLKLTSLLKVSLEGHGNDLDALRKEKNIALTANQILQTIKKRHEKNNPRRGGLLTNVNGWVDNDDDSSCWIE